MQLHDLQRIGKYLCKLGKLPTFTTLLSYIILIIVPLFGKSVVKHTPRK